MKTTSQIFISIFLLVGMNIVNGQTNETNGLIKIRIDNYLGQGVKNGFSGAILVSKKGEIIINKGYGLADKEKGISNTANTVFDIGSNTKQFTGAAVLKLVEFGKLKVTDSINSFFFNLPNDKKNITIHQLLTHSAGFKESIGSDFDHISKEVFFEKVFTSELLHEPGLTYSYSNVGYSILARIIELTSEKEYETFLNEFLFEPSGMEQTGYLLPKWSTSFLARGYNRNVLDVGSTVIRYQEDGKVSWHLKGNGGINSTQEDMYKWYKALNENLVLSKLFFEKYTTSYIGNVYESFGYAYGWGITNSDRNTKRITHNGSNGAFSHSIIWLQEEDIIILYATNAGSPKVEHLAYEVEKIILDQSYQPKAIEKNPYFFVIDFIEHHSTNESNKLFDLINEGYSSDFDHSGVLNRLGYMTLRSDQNSHWAIELFKLNARLFKNDGNVWDSLGDGYLANGQKEEAIKSFKKAIELNNEGTVDKLKKILQKG